MRSFLAAMVAMLFASVASANPDGPVDVVVIQPSFQIGSGVVQPTGPVPPEGSTRHRPISSLGSSVWEYCSLFKRTRPWDSGTRMRKN